MKRRRRGAGHALGTLPKAQLVASATPKEPCPRCRKNRWRTSIKGYEWACRTCGQLRRIDPTRQVAKAFHELAEATKVTTSAFVEFASKVGREVTEAPERQKLAEDVAE